MLKDNYTLVGENLHYTIDVDYTSSYPGDGCECPDNDYCRCQIIREEDVIINADSVTAETILNLFIENKSQFEREIKINQILETDITLYAIGRILSINKMYDNESYKPKISSGYYGEELDGISLHNHIANNVTYQIYKFFSLNTLKEKIEYLLTLEYDHVLDDLRGKKWKIIEVDVNDISIPNEQHYKNIPQLGFYSDSNYSDIRCILRETGAKLGKPYKLTDGYHRLKNTNHKTIICLLAYDGE